MTATEVARNFAAVLDRVDRGETVTITRGSRRIAVMSPAPQAPAREVFEALASWGGELDDEFEADVRAARELLNTEVRDPWEEN